jgi:dihydroorotate dehydrogenase (fumarate)/dihydroorotate dehydrogenase
VYESLIRPVLFRFDPERAHNLAQRWCEIGGRSLLARQIAGYFCGFADARVRLTVAGLDFANPLGLAAGFDKNGRAVHMLGAFGFGHVEIGSVSAFPSPGNPPPRLFRIPQDRGIIVYYGVPNEGAEAVARRLRGQRFAVPLGINLVKTNDPARPAVEPDVYEDYARALQLLQESADYLVLNLSCPNSPGDRDFLDDLPKIHKLLARLAECSPRRPVFLKLKPTKDTGRLREIVAIADEFPYVAGFAINLPSGKPAELKLTTPRAVLEKMPGAVGGKPVEEFINGILAALYQITGPRSRYALLAAGGVFTAEDAYRKIRLGASLVQLYTGLVYRGPRIVKEILAGLVRLLARDGFATIAQAVGAEHGRER